MLKRLGKKVLPIIMATMLVAGMGAVCTSAVDVPVDKAGIVGTAVALSTFEDEYSGIRLESEAINLDDCMVFPVKEDLASLGIGKDFCEEVYSIGVLDSQLQMVDFAKTPVTAFLPSGKADCCVIYVDNETGKAQQIDAEYVNGNYKVNLVGDGNYIISATPLVEGEGEMTQQTLVDEKTGVTVSGVIPTDTKLITIDAIDVLENQGLDYDAMASESGDMANQLDLLKNIDAKIVCLVRNFEIVKPESGVVVTLPNSNADYEVRYCDLFNGALFDEFFQYDENGDHDSSLYEDCTDEELAKLINDTLNKYLLVLQAEYNEGNYTVNAENSGLFVTAPVDTFKVTADNVKALREYFDDIEDLFGETIETPTEVPTEVPTEAPTQTLTSAPTEAPTQAPTKSEGKDGKNGVATSDNVNAVALLMTLSASLATIFVFGKKKATK